MGDRSVRRAGRASAGLSLALVVLFGAALLLVPVGGAHADQASPVPAVKKTPTATATSDSGTTSKKSAKKSARKKSARKKTEKTVAAVTEASVCGSAAAETGAELADIPWQQTWLDPERLAPLATGAGQLVAVLDTGVSRTQEQIADNVADGYDTLRQAVGGFVDCASHGTAVASLIVAQKQDSVGLRGIAPRARVLPIRLADAAPATGSDAESATAGDVAEGIRWAVRHGATVIEVSPAFSSGTKSLKSAVRYALHQGVPVVAAVGDRHDDSEESDPVSYPAAYPGVIGVGSVDESFVVADTSMVNAAMVDVVAPGEKVIADSRVGGRQEISGTSLAAGVVAGTVALMLQADPGLTPEQVATRLEATADPVPGGQNSAAYGAGLVDPYRVVTEQQTEASPVAVAGVSAPTTDPAVVEAGRRSHRMRTLAGWIAVGALAVAGLLGLVGVAAPRGRRRAWRPGRALAVATPDPVAQDAEEEQLFAVPRF